MGKNESSQRFSEAEKAGVEFLRVDFSECFQQMRHLDEQIINLCKFAFFAYSGITASALGLYKFGVEKEVDLRGAASIIVGIGLIVGLFLFWLAMRNRVYFVRVTRYINEVRALFFKHRPMDFKNKTGIYTDWRKPAFYNWSSSQLWFCYMVAFLNAVLLGSLLYMYVGYTLCWNVFIIIFCSMLLLGIQVLVGISYLKYLDNKSAEKPGFREEKGT